VWVFKNLFQHGYHVLALKPPKRLGWGDVEILPLEENLGIT